MTQIQHTNEAYNKILEIFDKTIIKLLFSRQVTQYLALDKESQRYIYERFGLKKNVTFTPFSIPKEDVEFAYQNRKSDYEKTYFRAISVGHVSNLKNRFEIIKAWANVVKKYPNAKLVIIGGIFSERSAFLIKELKLVNNIEFTGRVPHQEVFEHMKSSDFSCMFLSSELPFAQGVGAANLETMAFGLPAVLDATEDFFGERFPFRSRKHFVMAENRDPHALSAKFIELFENPQLRKKVGMGGQKFVRETLDMDKVMDEMELIYKKVWTSSQYSGVHAPLQSGAVQLPK
jgi:glycosyltransferase involved in cell wall biosynthesis